jgi:hypothetical protein
MQKWMLDAASNPWAALMISPTISQVMNNLPEKKFCDVIIKVKIHTCHSR